MEEQTVVQTYVKPSTKEEALQQLEKLPTEVFSRFKGRGLGLIESLYPDRDGSDKLAYQAARDKFLLILSSISSSVTRKINDSLEILGQSKKK